MCTAFAASDVQILKGTQFPLSLALVFWLRIRVADIPAASSKVKKMSRISAFCWILVDQSLHSRRSIFANRIEQVKNTIFELEQIKNADCFLYGHVIYSNLVSFKTKSLYTNHFLNSKETCISQLVVKTYSHYTHQEPNCHKERNNQKDSTKRETNRCHTLVKNLFTSSRRLFPTNCFLMLVALW